MYSSEPPPLDSDDDKVDDDDEHNSNGNSNLAHEAESDTDDGPAPQPPVVLDHEAPVSAPVSVPKPDAEPVDSQPMSKQSSTGLSDAVESPAPVPVAARTTPQARVEVGLDIKESLAELSIKSVQTEQGKVCSPLTRIPTPV